MIKRIDVINLEKNPLFNKNAIMYNLSIFVKCKGFFHRLFHLFSNVKLQIDLLAKK